MYVRACEFRASARGPRAKHEFNSRGGIIDHATYRRSKLLLFSGLRLAGKEVEENTSIEKVFAGVDRITLRCDLMSTGMTDTETVETTDAELFYAVIPPSRLVPSQHESS